MGQQRRRSAAAAGGCGRGCSVGLVIVGYSIIVGVRISGLRVSYTVVPLCCASEMAGEQDAEAVAALRVEMAEMRKKMEEMEKVKSGQSELKALARKAAIKSECDKYSNKAIKRNVKFLMVAMDLVTDMEEVWADLAKGDVEGEGIARADNLEEVNKAIDDMTTILGKQREHLHWEFDMNVSAADSKIGWGVVSQAEISKEKEGEVHRCRLKPEQIRKLEVEKMTYERQLRLMNQHAGSFKSGAGAGAGVASFDNIWLDGYAPRGAGRGKRSRGRGRGGVQEGARAKAAKPGVKCYRCEGPHYQRCRHLFYVVLHFPISF